MNTSWLEDLAKAIATFLLHHLLEKLRADRELSDVIGKSILVALMDNGLDTVTVRGPETELSDLFAALSKEGDQK